MLSKMKMIALLMLVPFIMTSGLARSQESAKEAWLRQFSSPVDSVSGGGTGQGGLMQLLKFRDAWWINTTDQGPEYIPDHPKAIAQRHPSIRVPKMFVTDLASIPRDFWSLLAPHDPYARAAVIHDWLYWNQSVSREMADEIFYYAMLDDRIDRTTLETIYWSVRKFGQSAWDENARRKRSGEQRVLAVLPRDPTTTWEHWKTVPKVFAQLHFERSIRSLDSPPPGAQPGR